MIKLNTEQYRGLIEPNQVIDITATAVGGTPPGSAQIAALKHGDIIFYFGGTIRYKDIFRVEHWSTFCAWVDTDLHSMRMWGRGNEIDINE